MPRERPRPVSLRGLRHHKPSQRVLTSNTAYQLQTCELGRDHPPDQRMWLITRLTPPVSKGKRQRAAFITKVTTRAPSFTRLADAGHHLSGIPHDPPVLIFLSQCPRREIDQQYVPAIKRPKVYAPLAFPPQIQQSRRHCCSGQIPFTTIIQ